VYSCLVLLGPHPRPLVSPMLYVEDGSTGSFVRRFHPLLFFFFLSNHPMGTVSHPDISPRLFPASDAVVQRVRTFERSKFLCWSPSSSKPPLLSVLCADICCSLPSVSLNLSKIVSVFSISFMLSECLVFKLYFSFFFPRNVMLGFAGYLLSGQNTICSF